MDATKLKSFCRMELAKANATYIKSKQEGRVNAFAEGKVKAINRILDQIERLENENAER